MDRYLLSRLLQKKLGGEVEQAYGSYQSIGSGELDEFELSCLCLITSS